MSHTPGQWHCHYATAVAEQADGEYMSATAITAASEQELLADGCRGDLIAFVPHDRSHEANARLIASAPDLLAVLKRADAEVWGDIQQVEAWLADANAAIAKAEGKA